MSMASADLIVGTKFRGFKGTYNGKEDFISHDAMDNKGWVIFQYTNGKEELTSMKNIKLIN